MSSIFGAHVIQCVGFPRIWPGHPVGATGVRQLLDAHRQVTGTAGAYQVEGAKRVATLNLGGSGTTSACFVVGGLSGK